MPRWKLASLSLVDDADRVGVGLEDVALFAEPGIRFARGTRFGSPDPVVPSDIGACAACAARQPSSAAEAHPPPAPALALLTLALALALTLTEPVED